MSAWTVIGLYDSTGEVYADHVEAPDQYAAMAIIADRTDNKEDLLILGATRGSVMLLTPGDDNGKAAYASDLADLTD